MWESEKNEASIEPPMTYVAQSFVLRNFTLRYVTIRFLSYEPEQTNSNDKTVI